MRGTKRNRPGRHCPGIERFLDGCGSFIEKMKYLHGRHDGRGDVVHGAAPRPVHTRYNTPNGDLSLRSVGLPTRTTGGVCVQMSDRHRAERHSWSAPLATLQVSSALVTGPLPRRSSSTSSTPPSSTSVRTARRAFVPLPHTYALPPPYRQNVVHVHFRVLEGPASCGPGARAARSYEVKYDYSCGHDQRC